MTELKMGKQTNEEEKKKRNKLKTHVNGRKIVYSIPFIYCIIFVFIWTDPLFFTTFFFSLFYIPFFCNKNYNILHYQYPKCFISSQNVYFFYYKKLINRFCMKHVRYILQLYIQRERDLHAYIRSHITITVYKVRMMVILMEDSHTRKRWLGRRVTGNGDGTDRSYGWRAMEVKKGKQR